MKRAAIVLASTTLLVTCSACGGESGPQLSDRNRKDLATRVDAVQASVVAFLPDTARAELSTLRAQVAELQQAKRISPDQAAAILSAAAAVEADLALAPTTTTTTTTTAPAPPETGNGQGEEKGKGKGKQGRDLEEGDD